MGSTFSYLALSALILAAGGGLWAIAAMQRRVGQVEWLALVAGSIIALAADAWHFSWALWVPNPQLTTGVTVMGLPVEEMVVVPGLLAFYSGIYVLLERWPGASLDARWGSFLLVLGVSGAWFTLMWPDNAGWAYATLVFVRLAFVGLLFAVLRRVRWVPVAAAISAPAIIAWTVAINLLGVYDYGQGTAAARGWRLLALSPEEPVAIVLDAMLGPLVVECARQVGSRLAVRKAGIWHSAARPEN